MPPGLSDKAIDHAEAESGTLADLLGREEGLKNPIPYFRRHPAAVVRDGHLYIRSGRAPGHGSLIQNDVPRFDIENATIRHGVAPIQSQVEESRLQQRRVDMAQPQSVIDPQLDLATSSDRLADEFLKFGYELVCVDQFWVQYLPSGKGKKLRRQLSPPIRGTSCGRCELPDPAIICRILDELEVRGDHHKQVVEVVRDSARELADGLHLLALVKLLLHEAARLHGVLVLGDVSEVERQALTGGERVERVPDTSA